MGFCTASDHWSSLLCCGFSLERSLFGWSSPVSPGGSSASSSGNWSRAARVTLAPLSNAITIVTSGQQEPDTVITGLMEPTALTADDLERLGQGLPSARTTADEVAVSCPDQRARSVPGAGVAAE